MSVSVVASGAVSAAPATETTTPDRSVAAISDLPVMRRSRLGAGELAAWYRARTPSTYRANVPLGTLAKLFIDEGRDEGIGGDVAFVQSVVETGWFSFPAGVPPSANNFSGLGATDGTEDYAGSRTHASASGPRCSTCVPTPTRA